jgi:hypothetical protein
MNESKSRQSNLVEWEKWRANGALGTMLDADTLPIRKTAKPIVGIGTQLGSNGKVISTLSIGDRPINLSASRPEVHVVVPGDPFEVGVKVRTRDLPAGTMTIAQAFPEAKVKL